MSSVIGKAYHTKEIKHLSKDSLVEGEEYWCQKVGTENPLLLKYKYGLFYSDKGLIMGAHYDDGPRTGHIKPIEKM